MQRVDCLLRSYVPPRQKMQSDRHEVTQKADGINTIPVKHPNAPADTCPKAGTTAFEKITMPAKIWKPQLWMYSCA